MCKTIWQISRTSEGAKNQYGIWFRCTVWHEQMQSLTDANRKTVWEHIITFVVYEKHLLHEYLYSSRSWGKLGALKKGGTTSSWNSSQKLMGNKISQIETFIRVAHKCFRIDNTFSKINTIASFLLKPNFFSNRCIMNLVAKGYIVTYANQFHEYIMTWSLSIYHYFPM